jgi:MFS family permease
MASADQSFRGRSSTAKLLTLTFAVTIGDYVEAMVLPAIPAIQRDFNTTPTLVSWVTSVLLIVGTASLPLFGKLGDIHGKKRMFLVALGIYTVGAGLAGIAPSIYILLVARAMQATGLVLGPLAFAMATDIFPKERQAYAQSVLGGVVAISTTAGYVLGSLVVQDLGWRYGFFTVLDASVLALVLTAWVLDEGPVVKGGRVDYAGALTLGGCMVFVLLYLTEGSSIGWASLGDLGLLTPGLVLLAAFLLLEVRTSSPLIELKLLRIRNFLVANSIRIIGGVSNFLFYYAFVYYAEYPKPYGLGLDVLSTGLVLAPATLSAIGWALVEGKLVAKVGPKPMLLVGSLALIAGLSLCILQRSSPLYLALDAVVAFSGWVTVILPSINMASLSLPKDQVTVGMGINSMLATLGQSFGPIIATTLLVSFTEPLTRVVNGHNLVVGRIASPMAFDLIFAVGIAFTCLIILASLFTRNYTFSENKAAKPTASRRGAVPPLGGQREVVVAYFGGPDGTRP